MFAPTALPKKFPVPKDKQDQCLNENVKRDGYWVGYGSVADDDYREDHITVKFVARHKLDDRDDLARLKAGQGICDDLLTYGNSRRCGIGKTLMTTCLEDPEITKDGGLDPDTYSIHGGPTSIWEDKEFSKEAFGNCEAIVAITCRPTASTPKIVCKSYIEAAQIANYHMVFVEHDRNNQYDVLAIEDMQNEFTFHPEEFLRSVGKKWFFCKCKRGKIEKCKSMVKYST